MITLEKALEIVSKKYNVYGAAETPDYYIFTVYEDPASDGVTVNKKTGALARQDFFSYAKDVDAGLVTFIDLNKAERAS